MPTKPLRRKILLTLSVEEGLALDFVRGRTPAATWAREALLGHLRPAPGAALYDSTWAQRWGEQRILNPDWLKNNGYMKVGDGQVHTHADPEGRGIPPGIQMEVPKPRFVHDCVHCTFLGPYTDTPEDGGRENDLYYCVGADGQGQDLIARYGDAGEEYGSCLVRSLQLHGMMKRYRVAFRRWELLNKGATCR